MEFLLRGFGEVTLPLRALQAINQKYKIKLILNKIG
jgi:hypothetical protein